MSVPTWVSLHAHPDDESLLTGGTLARAAAEGHRVVLVVATAGEAGLADLDDRLEDQLGDGLGERRVAELRAAAEALGVARVEVLGYADSGSDPGSGPIAGGFATLDPHGPASRVLGIVREERADFLTSYDAAGGYGHPDHRQVHRIGRLVSADADAEGVRLLEATLPGRAIRGAARAARLAGRWLPVPAMPDLRGSFSAGDELDFSIDVTPYVGAKLAALAAHRSQRTGNDGRRTASLLLSLPRPVQRAILGREWFHEPGRQVVGRSSRASWGELLKEGSC